ncbi:NusA-like transcription termination signal-binding factor [[Eubacterium] cellulosolvens]
MQSQRIRLKGEEMRLIALFESITGATSQDCLIDEENDRVILVTKKGEMGLAIGKAGRNINTLRKMTGRNIDVVEAADEPKQLIKNSLAPAKVKDIRITEKPDSKIAVVEVDSTDKAIAIGKNGKTIDKTRLLAKRYFQIDQVIIA